jgi:hypothetical protein
MLHATDAWDGKEEFPFSAWAEKLDEKRKTNKTTSNTFILVIVALVKFYGWLLTFG